MVDRRYREQYVDAVSVYMRDQEVAGLDILTDGDCRFDADVAGHNWFSYAPLHMDGFGGARAYAVKGGLAGIPHKPGHILHDVLETRVMPDIVGPIGRGISTCAGTSPRCPFRYCSVAPMCGYSIPPLNSRPVCIIWCPVSCTAAAV